MVDVQSPYGVNAPYGFIGGMCKYSGPWMSIGIFLA